MHTFWLSTDTIFSRNLRSKPRLFHGKDKIKKFRRLTLTVIPPRKSYLGFLCHVCLRRSCELHGSSEWRKTQFESTTCTWTLEALSPKLSSFHGTLFWQTVFIYLQSQEMSLNCSSKMKIINLWGFCGPFDLSSTHITSLFPQNRNAERQCKLDLLPVPLSPCGSYRPDRPRPQREDCWRFLSPRSQKFVFPKCRVESSSSEVKVACEWLLFLKMNAALFC